MSLPSIYQIYTELCDYEPKIWRRLLIKNNITMAQFAYIIMTVFEMKASHFFCFDAENIHIELMDKDVYYKRQTLNAAITKINDVISNGVETMTFSYDFGDEWKIHIELEKIIENEEIPSKELPYVIDGEGYGIIEDCGGTDSLLKIAKAFKDKNSLEYKKYCKWLETDELDLLAFDIVDINHCLKTLPKVYAGIYEQKY